MKKRNNTNSLIKKGSAGPLGPAMNALKTVHYHKKKKTFFRIKFKMKYLFLLLILLIFMVNCTSYTYIRGSAPYAKEIENKEYEVVDKSKGQSSSFHLMWLFPVTTPADYNLAIQEAINEKGGDNLIDIKFRYERQIWILGTVDILHVSGKVIRYVEESKR